MEAERIIVRREPKRNGSGIILFFPDSGDDEFRKYEMLCYTYKDGHNNASHQYYLECTPIFTDYDNGDDIKKILSDYVRYVRTLPDMENYGYKRVYRISRK